LPDYDPARERLMELAEELEAQAERLGEAPTQLD